MSGNRGCWFAISKCFGGGKNTEGNIYSKVSSENIEFEDLIAADQRALELKKKKQVVTETEKEHVMNGNLNQLVEQQKRLDEEREAQMRRHEEALRREEEAYYAAKREAANRKPRQVRAPVTLEIEQSDQSEVAFNFPLLQPPLVPIAASVPAQSVSATPSNALTDRSKGQGFIDSEVKDDDDFDQFLESVKVKQLSLTKKIEPLPKQPVSTAGASDSEEEIDFGFWEKAPDPLKKDIAKATDKLQQQPQSGPDKQTDGIQEADLALL